MVINVKLEKRGKWWIEEHLWDTSDEVKREGKVRSFIKSD